MRITIQDSNSGNDWISVKDELPYIDYSGIPYLTYDGHNHDEDEDVDEFIRTWDQCEYHLAYYFKGEWRDHLGNKVYVTHWKPIYPPLKNK